MGSSRLLHERPQHARGEETPRRSPSRDAATAGCGTAESTERVHFNGELAIPPVSGALHFRVASLQEDGAYLLIGLYWLSNSKFESFCAPAFTIYRASQPE